MFVSLCSRGTSARGRAQPEGLLPWVVDSALVLTGFETAGDIVDLLTGGVSAAAADVTVDAAAAVACDVLVAVALALGFGDDLLGGHGAQVLALLAKLGTERWAALAACVLAGPVVLHWEFRNFAPRRAVSAAKAGCVREVRAGSAPRSGRDTGTHRGLLREAFDVTG